MWRGVPFFNIFEGLRHSLVVEVMFCIGDIKVMYIFLIMPSGMLRDFPGEGIIVVDDTSGFQLGVGGCGENCLPCS
jgi:hypothetical protein